MTCKEFEKQIVLYPELTDLEKEKVMVHLKTCSSCSELFEAVTVTANMIKGASAVSIELKNPSRLTSAIMSRIEASEQRPKWFTFSFLELKFSYLKYGMAALSFVLVITFGVEQMQAPAIQGDPVSRGSRSNSVVLSRKTFQEELGKSKAAASLSLSSSCISPFNITKIDMNCLKQKMK